MLLVRPRLSLLLAVAIVAPVGTTSAATATTSAAAALPAAIAPLAHPKLVVIGGGRVAPLASKPKPKLTNPTPVGWKPSALAAAYGLKWSATSGTGMTIAIVDAYDSPTIEADLNTFSAQYSLPACTTANGCFKKINQNGGTKAAAANADWGLEISLDVEWAHAIAPGAKILLVEAATASFGDLMKAEDTARNSGAQEISNSWGAPEFAGESAYDSAWAPLANQTIFFAAGDDGVGAEYPSSAPTVVSVGGTTLSTKNTTVTETAWRGGGGGCSKYEKALAAQTALAGIAQVACKAKRATPDLAAVADPATGAGVFTTTPYWGTTGWIQVGGTSFASPVVAAIAADAGVTPTTATIYGSTMQWRDVTAGTNGAKCLKGFDLCSGRGAWINADTKPTPPAPPTPPVPPTPPAPPAPPAHA